MKLIAYGFGEEGFFVIARVRDFHIRIDLDDYEWAKQWRWNVVFNSSGRLAYISRSTRLHGAKGKQTRLYLHKEILKRAVGPGKRTHPIADHINGDSLDNRRHNLRWANAAMNAQNNPVKRAKGARSHTDAPVTLPVGRVRLLIA